jgi:putative tryptophan/tyrosine transport system substrate-binding protein
MRRREFIAGLGSAVAWPLAARAQQPAVPVIGYLSSRSSESDVSMLVAFRRGLNDTGYVEGRNLAIEYRFADGQSDLLPALGADLTSRQVAVIVFAGGLGAEEVLRFVGASQIPIVLNVGPAIDLLVSSYNHPGGNITGINSFVGSLTTKNMSLLHELVPNAKTIALLRGTSVTALFQPQVEDQAREAAATLGLQLLVLDAGTDGEIDAVFVAVNRQRPDAMLVASTPFFVTRAKQIAALAARQGVPAIYSRREYAEAGGLISYGYDVADGYRQIGKYADRILGSEKAGDLPVFQPTKFELVINLKTAKALGLTVPPTLLAVADEVIE